MHGSKWLYMVLAAAWMLTAAGCGASAPARRIGPDLNLSGVVSSTTGDQDRCALALGNVPDGQEAEARVSGVLVGNVAVVTTAASASDTDAGADQAALNRIRQSCEGVVQIRMVQAESDRAQLFRMIRSIRRGEPITQYLEQLHAISQGAEPLADAAGAALSEPQ